MTETDQEPDAVPRPVAARVLAQPPAPAERKPPEPEQLPPEEPQRPGARP